jgi:hypothetical protein
MNVTVAISVLVLSGWGLSSSGNSTVAPTVASPALAARSTTNGSPRLPPAYQPYSSQMSPRLAQAARISGYSPPTSGQYVKPFFNHKPAPSINPNAYTIPRRGFKDYNDYKAWLAR